MNALACETFDPSRNQLLAALPAAESDRWRPYLEPVHLAFGEVLFESGSTIPYIYFPTTAIVSLLHATKNGASIEIAVVGNEGVVGASLFLGDDTTVSQAMVQGAGQAYRLRAHVTKKEVNRVGPMRDMLLRYAHAMIAQVAQTAVCNRYHSIDQQLCRRLLLALDRSRSDELMMSHELLGNLLGVRRESVTAAALKLQEAGVIRYSRGHICVLDRERLQQSTCECYAAAKKEYDRLLPLHPTPAAPIYSLLRAPANGHVAIPRATIFRHRSQGSASLPFAI